MRDTLREGRSGHLLRPTLMVVAILLVGAVLGVGALKAYHKIRGPSVALPGAIASLSRLWLVGADVGDGCRQRSVRGQSSRQLGECGQCVDRRPRGDPLRVVVRSGPADLHHEGGIRFFVANGAGDSVTEFGAADRTAVHVIAGPQFQFSDPIALTADPNELFVLSATGAITGVSPTTGGLLGVAAGPQYGFRAPSSIAVSGSDLFVTNSAGNSVSVIDAGTLGLIKLLKGPQYRFHTPTAAVIHGGDLWVTNRTSDSVTQLSASTGNLVRVIVDHTNLPTPGPITAGDGYVFTLSPPGVSPMVSQIDPAKGKVNWMMCNGNGPYLFANPQAVAVAGSNLWVVNKDSNSLTEMDTDTGDLIRTIS